MIEIRPRSDSLSEWAQRGRDRLSWVKSEGESTELKKPSVATAHPHLGALVELLICNEDSLPQVGSSVARWLEDFSDSRSLMLGWLAFRAQLDSFEGRIIREHNRVAVIELAARNGIHASSLLIRDYLSLPLRKYHLFIVPLARIPNLLKGNELGAAATEIVRLFRESTISPSTERWQESFAVEVFRTLADISPNEVVNSVSAHLDKVRELELTAVLESVSLAARKSTAECLAVAPLRESALRLWRQYQENRDSTRIGNRPGIMGRLVEILGRSGLSVDDLLQGIADHPLGRQVLYQSVQRPLEFMPTDQRLRLYGRALEFMVETNQLLAAKRFMKDVFLTSLGPSLEKSIFRWIGTEAEKVGQQGER